MLFSNGEENCLPCLYFTWELVIKTVARFFQFSPLALNHFFLFVVFEICDNGSWAVYIGFSRPEAVDALESYVFYSMLRNFELRDQSP